MSQQRGVVKFYNSDRGFGFLSPLDGGRDVFFHVSALQSAGLPPPFEGQELLFEVAVDRRSGKSAAQNLQAA
jgi:CspA family cold shock protein